MADRKLQSNEFPHQIFVKKYSSASSSQTCLYLRKWLFTRAHEAVAISDDPTLELFYHQAVEDVSKGKIPVGGQLGQLKTLSSQGKKQQVHSTADTVVFLSTHTCVTCK